MRGLEHRIVVLLSCCSYRGRGGLRRHRSAMTGRHVWNRAGNGHPSRPVRLDRACSGLGSVPAGRLATYAQAACR
ncbi:hypothetical protein AvCA_18140 [Azotobacter vinelandii CA]|uniref:Uncharacterized protein n=2 Tax=Azotobacter vinelandii TaxID=354 RepID=C1DDQ6_AZOVD|nr:hypothetical protein Avin_18140 [Azotobacter vinelandii DJ]AGK16888.1 hypothetical protein AvCA_18140 [Azotobacter vinelandii CA]AGK20183.1 hypothetical protein AvCA6_18140 [Azotobacter vinelandii CA6]